MDLNLYDKFSAYTNLPIQLDWVASQVREDCGISEILFISAQMDPDVLLGMHRMFERSHPDGSKERVLHIYYSSSLDEEHMYKDKRLICCKELLHAYDGDKSSAASLTAVDNLIEGIVVPPSFGMSASLKSDHNGAFHALIVLLPRDALDILIPQYEQGQINVEDVALLAGIPEAYARFGLSKIWKDIVERI